MKMPRRTKRITHQEILQIVNSKKVGRHPCKDNLYLNVTQSKTINWCIVYDMAGVRKNIGMGAYHPKTNSLALARAKCDDYLVMIRKGIDPKIEEQRARDLQLKASEDRQKLQLNTFAQYAYQHIKSLEPIWTSPKTSAQWRSSLESYAFPVIGETPVSDVSRVQVLEILQPIWFEKTETADRVRRRIAAVLDAAIDDELREARNPASVRSLRTKLPSVESVKNAKAPPEERAHPSLQYSDLPLFMDALRRQDGTGARALEFCILNGNRTAAVLETTWDEFDLEEGVWSIPERRMKGQKRHTIPLSKQSIALIQEQQQLRISEFVFPNRSNGNSLSQAGMSSVLKRMHKITEWKDIYGQLITVHGFRGCFKTWTSEKTDTDWLTGEMALAHKIKDKSSATYQKGQLIDKRRRLMQQYSDYAYGTPLEKVVQLRG